MKNSDEPVHESVDQRLSRRQGAFRPFWYASFRDPLPLELIKRPQTLYEALDGLDALERLTRLFYEAILPEPDPLLERGLGSPRAAKVLIARMSATADEVESLPIPTFASRWVI